MSDVVSPNAGLSVLAPQEPGHTGSGGSSEAFLETLESGLSQLSSRPDIQTDANALDSLSDPYAGAIGAEKSQMMAREDLTGAEAEAASAEAVEARFQKLYYELTHYQVAWRIAQNVQRDISQVLRGS